MRSKRSYCSTITKVKPYLYGFTFAESIKKESWKSGFFFRFFIFYRSTYAIFSFAISASFVKPAASFTAISASIFLLISISASFNPCINLL